MAGDVGPLRPSKMWNWAHSGTPGEQLWQSVWGHETDDNCDPILRKPDFDTHAVAHS